MKLETWQVAYALYMWENTAYGKQHGITDLLKLEVTDSFFCGPVARTFQQGFEAGYRACDKQWMECKEK